MREQPTWQDLKKVARFAGEISEAREDREVVLLRALTDLIGAPFAQLYRAELLPRDQLRLVTFHDRGTEGKAQARILEYVAANGQDDPTIAAGLRALRKSASPIVLPRQALLTDREFYALSS